MSRERRFPKYRLLAIVMFASLSAIYGARFANAQTEEISVIANLNEDLTAPLGEQFTRTFGIKVNFITMYSVTEMKTQLATNNPKWDAAIGYSADSFAELASLKVFNPIAKELDASWPSGEFGDPDGLWLPIGAVYSNAQLPQETKVDSGWEILRKADPKSYEQPSIDGVAVFNGAQNSKAAQTFAKWISTDPAASQILKMHYLMVPTLDGSPDRVLPRSRDLFLASFGGGSCISCKTNTDCKDPRPKCSAQGCCISN